jgi:hypothetical protein
VGEEATIEETVTVEEVAEVVVIAGVAGITVEEGILGVVEVLEEDLPPQWIEKKKLTKNFTLWMPMSKPIWWI